MRVRTLVLLLLLLPLWIVQSSFLFWLPGFANVTISFVRVLLCLIYCTVTFVVNRTLDCVAGYERGREHQQILRRPYALGAGQARRRSAANLVIRPENRRCSFHMALIVQGQRTSYPLSARRRFMAQGLGLEGTCFRVLPHLVGQSSAYLVYRFFGLQFVTGTDSSEVPAYRTIEVMGVLHSGSSIECRGFNLRSWSS